MYCRVSNCIVIKFLLQVFFFVLLLLFCCTYVYNIIIVFLVVLYYFYYYIIFFFFLFFIKTFGQKCVQDMSNSTRANTRTLPECASIKDKK